jgi:hypothetical protein
MSFHERFADVLKWISASPGDPEPEPYTLLNGRLETKMKKNHNFLSVAMVGGKTIARVRGRGRLIGMSSRIWGRGKEDVRMQASKQASSCCSTQPSRMHVGKQWQWQWERKKPPILLTALPLTVLYVLYLHGYGVHTDRCWLFAGWQLLLFDFQPLPTFVATLAIYSHSHSLSPHASTSRILSCIHQLLCARRDPESRISRWHEMITQRMVHHACPRANPYHASPKARGPYCTVLYPPLPG